MLHGIEDVVKLLLNRGADINLNGGLDNYPIIAAADEGDEGVVEILVKHGANVTNVKGYEDDAPVIVLAGYSLPKESMELLLDHGADIEATDDHGNTVLISTANSVTRRAWSFCSVVGPTSMHVVSNGVLALHVAASEGDEGCSRLLIKGGADVNHQGRPWGSAS